MSAEAAAHLAERARILAGVKRAQGDLAGARALGELIDMMRDEADNAVTAPIVVELCGGCGQPVRRG